MVILAVKSQDTGGALDALAAAAPDRVPVACAQNGVENERAALRLFGDVYGVHVMLPAAHLEPGLVQASSAPVTGMLDVGRFPSGSDETAHELAAAFNASTFDSRALADVMRWKYRKLIMNLGNAVEALIEAGPPQDEIADRAEEEGEACLRAAGIDFASREEDRVRRGDLLRLRPVGGRERGGGSSWQSLARGSGSDRDRLPERRDRAARAPARIRDAGQRAAPAAREPVGRRTASAGNATGGRVRADAWSLRGTMNELLNWSAGRMALAVRKREVSPVELVEAHLARIEERNGALNAIVIPRFDDALAAARAAERGLSDGSTPGPLHGVPFTVKDGIPVAGLPNPMGVKKLAGEVARKDAAAVCSLRGAGAILLGKTNVPEFLIHYDAVNSLFGPTHNPHDPTRTAGGSSGGEAAAIASGMSPFGVGSDLGGSIRFPAHCNGVFGFKPSRFTVPSADHFPGMGTIGIRLFGAIGPLARSAEDLELLFSVLATRRANSDPDAFPPLAATAPTRAAAAFEEDGLQPVSAECREAVRRAAGALAEQGHEVVWEAPPGMPEVRETYGAILSVDMAATLLPLMRETLSEDSPPYVHDLVEQMAPVEPTPAYVEGVRASGRARTGGGLVARAPLDHARSRRAGDGASARRGLHDRRRAADRAGREAHALHIRERARAAGRERPGDALRRRPADRRPGDRAPWARPPRDRRRAEARGSVRRLDRAPGGAGREGAGSLVPSVEAEKQAAAELAAELRRRRHAGRARHRLDGRLPPPRAGRTASRHPLRRHLAADRGRRSRARPPGRAVRHARPARHRDRRRRPGRPRRMGRQGRRRRPYAREDRRGGRRSVRRDRVV